MLNKHLVEAHFAGFFLIPHQRYREIYCDLLEKSQHDKINATKILETFEEVYNGKEPDDVLQKVDLITEPGENPEALLKAYKWIWGQEDVNYPPPYKGRAMSWEGWEKKTKKMVKTGEGLKDLLERLTGETENK